MKTTSLVASFMHGQKLEMQHRAIGKVLVVLRKEKELTQMDISLDGTISQATVSFIEKYGGGRIITLLQYLEVLEIKPSEFFLLYEKELEKYLEEIQIEAKNCAMI